MASTGKLSLRPSTPRPLTSSDAALVDTLRNRARWIWIKELDSFQPPKAPDFEQRAFRKVLTFPTSKGKPTSAKFVIGADDYFGFYLDGVMVQPADGTHGWRDLAGFQIPLPIIRNTTTNTMTVALRVVNGLGGDTGLIVGAQVTYESGEPDNFFTGVNDSWTTERSFDEGWEQPWYSASGWAHAEIYPLTTRSPSDPNMNDLQSVGVFEQLTTNSTSVTTSGECIGVVEHGTSITMSLRAFVGGLVGSVLAAMAIGALASYCVTRRKAQRAQNQRDEIPLPPMPEPVTPPGTQHRAGALTTHQLGGVSSALWPSNQYRPTPFSYVAQEDRNLDGLLELSTLRIEPPTLRIEQAPKIEGLFN